MSRRFGPALIQVAAEGGAPGAWYPVPDLCRTRYYTEAEAAADLARPDGDTSTMEQRLAEAEAYLRQVLLADGVSRAALVVVWL